MSELLLPYEGNIRLSSKYGYRQLNGKTEFHKGIDLIGIDSKIVRSPCDGFIISSTIIEDKNNLTWEWGNYVRIDTKNISIFLCHLQERRVKVGQYVEQGEIIGIEGNTGYSFGCHTHFEIRKNGTYVDPCPYVGIANEIGIYSNKEYGHNWSKDAIRWAIKNNILKGYSKDEEDYGLDLNVTREELVTILYRYNELLNK